MAEGVPGICERVEIIGVRLKDHTPDRKLFHLTFLLPTPAAHKEPGKARANSLVSVEANGPLSLHKQVTIARAASLPWEPQKVLRPLLRQRRGGGCFLM